MGLGAVVHGGRGEDYLTVVATACEFGYLFVLSSSLAVWVLGLKIVLLEYREKLYWVWMRRVGELWS